MKKLIILSFTLFLITTINAQEIGKIEIKKQSLGLKKINESPKKIFIQHFFINYQMIFDQIEIAKGGREIGGGMRSDAKAQLVLGVQGIDATDLQEITDKLFEEYKSRLETAGFTIVTASEVANEKPFEGWQLLEGGTPSKAQFPGFVSTAPTGFEYLVKKINKKGKRKTTKNIFDNGAPTSTALGGIFVARVNIVIPFIKDAESGASKALTKSFGGVAKIVVRPELSVATGITVISKAAIGEKVQVINTSSIFVYKKSLKYQASLIVTPKKAIKIKGVFEDTKYKAIKSASQDLWGSNYGATTIFSVTDQVLLKMQAVPCEKEKYVNGVLSASSGYLNKLLDEFLQYIK